MKLLLAQTLSYLFSRGGAQKANRAYLEGLVERGHHCRVVAPAAIRAGGEMAGEELAEWSPPLTSDNFEGIAVRRNDSGETLIYIVSDDNFSPLQRTLLLMFALAE